MGEESPAMAESTLCDHTKQRHYRLRRFDILKGFELSETRCCNCHKLLVLEIRALRGEHGENCS